MTLSQLESLDKLKPDLSRRHKQVLELIGKSPEGLALWQVAYLLNLPVHSVSGRITELRDKGLLRDTGRVRWNAQTRRNTTVWERYTPSKEQEEFGFIS